tara:strand:+ start:1132 stop:1299 length:168 start_codon:yes stop_codon:yes gene_type:complete
VRGNKIARDCALPKPGNAPNKIPRKTPESIINTVVNVKRFKIKLGKLSKISISIN